MKNKLNVMYEKPEVSDAELEKFMDFDQVLAKRAAFIKKRRMQHVTIATSALLVMALVSWWIFSPDVQSQKQRPQELVTKSSAPAPEELKVMDSTSLIPKKEEQKPGTSTVIKEKNNPLVEPLTQKEENEVLSDPVYIQSAPVDGYTNLYSYFERELRYPKEAITDSIQGTVTVHCMIGKDGRPKNIQIENSLGEVFDKEVLRIIEHMPAWNPATLNGKPKDSKISLPLSFTLKSTHHD